VRPLIRSTRTLLGGAARRPSSRRLAWFVMRPLSSFALVLVVACYGCATQPASAPPAAWQANPASGTSDCFDISGAYEDKPKEHVDASADSIVHNSLASVAQGQADRKLSTSYMAWPYVRTELKVEGNLELRVTMFDRDGYSAWFKLSSPGRCDHGILVFERNEEGGVEGSTNHITDRLRFAKTRDGDLTLQATREIWSTTFFIPLPMAAHDVWYRFTPKQ